FPIPNPQSLIPNPYEPPIPPLVQPDPSPQHGAARLRPRRGPGARVPDLAGEILRVGRPADDGHAPRAPRTRLASDVLRGQRGRRKLVRQTETSGRARVAARLLRPLPLS